jgi:hypothetical protein
MGLASTISKNIKTKIPLDVQGHCRQFEINFFRGGRGFYWEKNMLIKDLLEKLEGLA